MFLGPAPHRAKPHALCPTFLFSHAHKNTTFIRAYKGNLFMETTGSLNVLNAKRNYLARRRLIGRAWPNFHAQIHSGILLSSRQMNERTYFKTWEKEFLRCTRRNIV